MASLARSSPQMFICNICNAVLPALLVCLVAPAGIGKSAFGLYALYMAVTAGRTVVYQAKKTQLSLLFRDGRVYEVTFSSSPKDIRELNDPKTVYILDNLVAPTVAAFTLLITSPKKENWFGFTKSLEADYLVFPVFSLPEMLRLRDVAFRNDKLRDDKAVNERFTKWGGEFHDTF